MTYFLTQNKLFLHVPYSLKDKAKEKVAKRKSNQDCLSFNDILVNAKQEFQSSEVILNDN